MQKYIIATIHEWNIQKFQEHFKDNEQFILISDKKKLTFEYLKEINPKYIFFPHWSWIVPNEIIKNFECVCFHMTDVPYGRGGSPLQNLILRGHKETKLTALKMVNELDAGDYYLKEEVSLEGRAEDIYKRVSSLIFVLIEKMIKDNPGLTPQQGNVVHFERRKPYQSELSLENFKDKAELYDFIRMLDAPSYPHAYIDFGNFKVYFKDIIPSKEGYKGTFEIKESDYE
ncbi:MAG: methionyl-tRNA formyltransferase [Halobacteriovoraceae bacterium]|nr:methionyl-tRNA formyltransferase [Halobacteriovoraceae bacterium]